MQQPVEQLADEPRHKAIVEELRQECGVGLLTAMVYRTEIGIRGPISSRATGRQVRGVDADEPRKRRAKRS